MDIPEVTALGYIGVLTCRINGPCSTVQAYSKYKRNSLNLRAGSKWIDKSQRNKRAKVDVSDHLNYCFLSLSEPCSKTEMYRSQIKEVLLKETELL